MPDFNPDVLQQGILNGQPIYFAHHRIESLDWTVVLIIPQENIETQLESLNLLAGVLGIILAIATILAGRQINYGEQSQPEPNGKPSSMDSPAAYIPLSISIKPYPQP